MFLSRLIFGLFAVVAMLFLIVPIGVLLGYGLQAQSWPDLLNSAVYDALTLSLSTTVISLGVVLLFGTPLAYVLARGRFWGRGFINVLVELPIVLPPAVAGLALLLTFGRMGAFAPVMSSLGLSLAFSTAAVVMAQAFVSAPFYIRAAIVGFQGVPREVEDAARVDGASPWRVFRYITVPLAARSLGAGMALSWARALGEFGATILFAGSLRGRTQTMPLLIYNILERDLDAAVMAGVLLVGLALVALLLARWLQRNTQHDSISQFF